MAKVIFEFENQTYTGDAQKIGTQLWVHLNGETFAVDLSEGSRKRQKGVALKGGPVVAPMPGKVTKILVNNGDGVAAGQSVVVMEAMKMEYTLKSNVDGTVEQIHCAVNEQVVLGKTLVDIKENK